MDLFCKYIIEDGALILSKCTYHAELATDTTKVKGGGMFRFDNDVFTLFGSSHDFGRARLEDVQKAIDDDRVYTNPYTDNSIAKRFKFIYDNQSSLINLN